MAKLGTMMDQLNGFRDQLRQRKSATATQQLEMRLRHEIHRVEALLEDIELAALQYGCAFQVVEQPEGIPGWRCYNVKVRGIKDNMLQMLDAVQELTRTDARR